MKYLKTLYIKKIWCKTVIMFILYVDGSYNFNDNSEWCIYTIK